MASANRKDAILEISQYCVDNKIVSELGIVVNPVSEREKLASTAIGSGVALPHCRMGNLENTLVVFALLKNPVDWNSPDKKPVNMVFLLLSPDEHPEEYLKAMRTISLALQNPGFIYGLKQSFTKESTADYLKKYSVSV